MNNHIGRKISRIRELRGMKQETLAEALGVSQQSVSKLEQSETIEPNKLEEVAKVLGVSPEAIENYSDEAVFNNIQNNYDGSVVHSGPTVNYECTFNPLDKVVELYERLVQAEKDKVEYLEKLLNKD
tara:strand:- start:799 stop:1179 length:381 start_codon:yes stop_codon:yes gene_type:complete